VVIVLAALLVGVDRIGAAIAERIAGDKIKSSQHLSRRPDVGIAGFPFLTQFAAGHYDDITVTVHDFQIGKGRLDRPLIVDPLVVHLHDVSVSRDFRSLTAGSATADAHASYAALSTTLGTRVAYDGPADGGRVKTSVRVTVAGFTVAGSVSTAVRASSRAGLRFVDPRVLAGGRRSPAVNRALAALAAVRVPLVGVPFGIAVDGADVTPAGLVLHLRGTHISYRR
jgi:hypothetical protein